MTLWKWSVTADNNDAADTSVNLREGLAPSSLNNAMRAMMAAVAKYRDDISGNLVLGGTLTAYTATTSQVLTVLTDGFTFYARANVTNGLNPTLAVDGLTAKAIQSRSGVAVGYGTIIKDAIYKFTYDGSADAWLVANAPGASRKIGETIVLNGTTLPDLCLWENGQAVSRTTYAVLFLEIGTTHGVGDGSTTFNVPDSRGRVDAGKDDMGGSSANRLTGLSGGVDGDILGATGGAETHTLTTAQIEAHVHASGTLVSSAIGDHGHPFTMSADDNANSGFSGGMVTHTNATAVKGANAGGAGTGDGQQIGGGGAHQHAISGSTANAGGSAAHNNVPPTIVKNKCIFAGV